ncbi:hypothetical protein E4U50_001640 [Claviceps purpurea]|nr:hypothetical protein E4U50_001640 [Claviceps purpurea]
MNESANGRETSPFIGWMKMMKNDYLRLDYGVEIFYIELITGFNTVGDQPHRGFGSLPSVINTVVSSVKKMLLATPGEEGCRCSRVKTVKVSYIEADGCSEVVGDV